MPRALNPFKPPAVWTPRLVKEFLALSPFSDTEPNMATVLSRLTKSGTESFQNVLAANHELAKRYSYFWRNFAAVQHPHTSVWPEFEPVIILEELYVDCGDLQSLVFLIDGRRFIRWKQPTGPELVSFEEFSFRQDTTVEKYLLHIATGRIARLQRALALASATKCVESDEGFVTTDNKVGSLHLVYWAADQVEAYFRRFGYQWLTTPPKKG
jgi:hypothetical protein